MRLAYDSGRAVGASAAKSKLFANNRVKSGGRVMDCMVPSSWFSHGWAAPKSSENRISSKLVGSPASSELDDCFLAIHTTPAPVSSCKICYLIISKIISRIILSQYCKDDEQWRHAAKTGNSNTTRSRTMAANTSIIEIESVKSMKIFLVCRQ